MKTIITMITALIAMTSAALAVDLAAASSTTEILCWHGECSQAREGMIESAKGRVASVLREPESAKFRDLYLTTGKDKKSPAVCGLVNGRNAYGGMAGYKRFYITEDDDLMILNGKKDSLRPHWHYHCDPKGWR